MDAPDDAGRTAAGTASTRLFWLLTSSASVSELGNTFLNLAMPWIILQGTGSSILAALSLGVQYVPFVLSPAFGALIDGFERRRVYMVAELLQGSLIALIPLLLGAHQVIPALLLLLLASCGMAVSNLTSSYSLLPMLAPPDRVTQAYSWYGTATELAHTAGPAVAGVVLATLGGSWALWIDAATFLLTALAATVLPRGERPVAERSFVRMQVEGLRSFRRIRGIPRLTAVLSLYNLGAGAMAAVMLLLIEHSWRWSSGWAGMVIAAGSAGSALGAFLGGRVWLGKPSERRIGLWFTVCATSCLGLLAPWPPLVIAGFCGLLAGEGGMNITTNEYRFRAIPQELAGRTNAVMRVFILGAAALSALLLGWSVSLPHQVLRFAPALLTSTLAVMVWAGMRRRAAEAAEEPAQAQQSRA